MAAQENMTNKKEDGPLSERERKMKEIQDRLSEIQSKSKEETAPSNPPAAKKKPSVRPAGASKEKAPEPKKTPATPTTSKKENSATKKNTPPQKSNPQWTDNQLKTDAKPAPSGTKVIPIRKETFEQRTEKGTPSKSPATKKKKTPPKPPSKLGKVLPFILAGLVIMILGATFFITIWPEFKNQVAESSMNTALTADEGENPSPSEAQMEDESMTEETVMEPLSDETPNETIIEEEESLAAEAEESDPEETTMEPEVKETPVTTASKPVAEPSGGIRTSGRSSNLPFTTPAYIISYSANGEEKYARNNVLMLEGKGWPAGYFWIPDYMERGSKMFKVYVGPYQSESEALKVMREVAQINQKVYLMRMD